MVLPSHTVPASAPSARPSRLSACLAAWTTPGISFHPGSYHLTTSSRSPSTILSPCSCPPPPVGGSTVPLTSFQPPSEHSPCCSVTFGSIGGKYTPDGSTSYAIGGGTSNRLPNKLSTAQMPTQFSSHRRMGHSCKRQQGACILGH
jgi:hypothetical protein